VQFALRRQPFPAAGTGPAGWRQPLHQALRGHCRLVLVPQHDVDPAVVRSDGPAQVVREQQEVCSALVDEQDQIGQEAVLDRPWSERVRRDRPVSVLVLVLVLVLVHHVRHPRLQQRNDGPDAVLELPGPHGILDQEHTARLSSELFHRPNDPTEPPDHRASVAAVPDPLPTVGKGVETDPVVRTGLARIVAPGLHSGPTSVPAAEQSGGFLRRTWCQAKRRSVWSSGRGHDVIMAGGRPALGWCTRRHRERAIGRGPRGSDVGRGRQLIHQEPPTAML